MLICCRFPAHFRGFHTYIYTTHTKPDCQLSDAVADALCLSKDSNLSPDLQGANTRRSNDNRRHTRLVNASSGEEVARAEDGKIERLFKVVPVDTIRQGLGNDANDC